jgi:hypothetical protein
MANLRSRIPPADGITVRQKSRVLFQRHRSKAIFYARRSDVCRCSDSDRQQRKRRDIRDFPLAAGSRATAPYLIRECATLLRTPSSGSGAKSAAKSIPVSPKGRRSLTTVSHTLQVDHSLSKDAFREGIPESGASAVPAGGRIRSVPRAAWASSCRHYDRHVRSSLDWDRRGAGNTRSSHVPGSMA